MTVLYRRRLCRGQTKYLIPAMHLLGIKIKPFDKLRARNRPPIFKKRENDSVSPKNLRILIRIQKTKSPVKSLTGLRWFV